MEDRSIDDDELAALEERIAGFEIAVTRCHMQEVDNGSRGRPTATWREAARHYEEAAAELRVRRAVLLKQRYPDKP